MITYLLLMDGEATPSYAFSYFMGSPIPTQLEIATYKRCLISPEELVRLEYSYSLPLVVI